MRGKERIFALIFRIHLLYRDYCKYVRLQDSKERCRKQILVKVTEERLDRILRGEEVA